MAADALYAGTYILYALSATYAEPDGNSKERAGARIGGTRGICRREWGHGVALTWIDAKLCPQR